MTPAPILPDETDRLQALHRLLILDTPPEERFDRVVSFAAQEFDMPMAQIALIDARRLWFKSRLGLEGGDVDRASSICGHIVEAPRGLIIEDLTQDTRFSDSPYVTDGLRLRFYAGAPLILPDGHTVGALCVLDHRPRRFDTTDRAILDTLRDLVVRELAAQADHADR